jgi:hypothetical protein
MSCRYSKLHKKLMGTYRYGMPPPPANDILGELRGTFVDWLKAHDLLSLSPVFMLCPIVFNYHFLVDL